MTEFPDGRTGRCLCGGVTYRASLMLPQVLQCHCENCRRLSGNFVAASRTETSDLHISDPKSHLQWYDLGYAAYGFCRNCGATLFFRAADRQDITSVMVGTLDDAAGLALHAVWFANEAQPFNELPKDLPHFQGNG